MSEALGEHSEGVPGSSWAAEAAGRMKWKEKQPWSRAHNLDVEGETQACEEAEMGLKGRRQGRAWVQREPLFCSLSF